MSTSYLFTSRTCNPQTLKPIAGCMVASSFILQGTQKRIAQNNLSYLHYVEPNSNMKNI